MRMRGRNCGGREGPPALKRGWQHGRDGKWGEGGRRRFLRGSMIVADGGTAPTPQTPRCPYCHLAALLLAYRNPQQLEFRNLHPLPSIVTSTRCLMRRSLLCMLMTAMAAGLSMGLVSLNERLARRPQAPRPAARPRSPLPGAAWPRECGDRACGAVL